METTKLILTPAQQRDFEMVKPYLEGGNWVTSISLAQKMYRSGGYLNKEIAKISLKLSNLYAKTNLLERKEARKLYFPTLRRNISTYAYKLNPEVTSQPRIQFP